MARNAPIARFRWIREVRAEMDRAMKGMSPEECAEHVNRGYEDSRKRRPQYTLDESRALVGRYLADPDALMRTEAARPRVPARKRRAMKRTVHA